MVNSINTSPFLSVITPCYDVENYLHECVESILAQHFSNWELILVDDGSTDMTPQICDEYAAKDNRIKVIHKKNGGVSSARNAALAVVRSKWITFIDSDDWFEPNAFRIFIDTIDKKECDRYIFNRYIVNGGIKRPVNPVDTENLFRQNNDLKWFLLDMISPDYDNMINKVHVSGIRGVNCNFYKAATILDNGIKFEETMRIAEDAMFNYDVMLHSDSVMLCYEVVGNYRVSDGAVMHKFTHDILNVNNTTLEGIYGRIGRLISVDKDYCRVYVNAVAECMFRAMKLYFVHPNNKKSYSDKKKELEQWLSNELVRKALDVTEMEYIPKGKKEIFKALKDGNYLMGGGNVKDGDVLSPTHKTFVRPLVSIIVPVYKVPEKYLRQCIESCINQTLKEIEIILIDDGSPDECGKICDEYAAKDKRIRVIHKENGGLAAARNTGQDVANGQTIMFLDGDDYLEFNCCELTYKKLKEHDVELVMFDQYVNYPNSQLEQHSFDDDYGERLFVGEECRKLQARVLDFNGKIAMAFMKLMKADYLRKNNIRHIDELKQGAEGFVFNIQLYEHLEKAYYLNKPLLHYIYNSQSISHTASVKNNMMIIRCMEWIDEYVKHSTNPQNLHPVVLNRMLYVIITTAITGYFNPYNPYSHKEKVKGFLSFMSNALVSESIQNAPRKGLDFQREMIICLIKMRLYRVLALLGWLRRKQLENK